MPWRPPLGEDSLFVGGRPEVRDSKPPIASVALDRSTNTLQILQLSGTERQVNPHSIDPINLSLKMADNSPVPV